MDEIPSQTNVENMTDNEIRLRNIVEKDEYNLDAWNELEREAVRRSVKDSSTVELWNFLVSSFPTSGRLWTAFLDAHLGVGNLSAAKDLFNRCLLTCSYLGLWRCYLRFMRQSLESKTVDQRGMLAAWDFTINHVGRDLNSGSLWHDYIEFLKSYTSVDESQRLIMARKAYQRAVVLPLLGVEQLWKDYEKFENGLNKVLAKTILAEVQPRHASARAVLQQRKQLFEGIDLSALTVPPEHSLQHEEQTVKWLKVLEHEKQNPLRLPADGFIKSVKQTFDQCLLYLRLHSHVWFDYSAWLEQKGRTDWAIDVLKKSILALPDNILLHFSLAELQERSGKTKDGKAVLEALITKDLGSQTNLSLAHIQLMRYVRRNEGVDSARKVFVSASKSADCTYHLYVASGLMEHAVNRESKVARKVFERGLEKFIREPAFILEYANFLRYLNDEKNMRALFEHALKVTPRERTNELWNSYIEQMNHFGENLSFILELEERRRRSMAGIEENEEDEEGRAQQKSLRDSAMHFGFRDLLPCQQAELAYVTRTKILMAKPRRVVVKQSQPQNVQKRAESQRNISLVQPDPSQMSVYDPSQGLDGPSASAHHSPQPSVYGATLGRAGVVPAGVTLPPAVAQFLAAVPQIPGPFPEVDMVISVFLENEIPDPACQQAPGGTNGTALTDLKRKEPESGRVAGSVPPLSKDIYRLRLLKKAKAGSSNPSGRTSGSMSKSGTLGSADKASG